MMVNGWMAKFTATADSKTAKKKAPSKASGKRANFTAKRKSNPHLSIFNDKLKPIHFDLFTYHLIKASFTHR